MSQFLHQLLKLKPKKHVTFSMALSKRNVYMLLVVTSGLLYFLYTYSSPTDYFTHRPKNVRASQFFVRDIQESSAHRSPLRKTSSLDSRNTSSPVVAHKAEDSLEAETSKKVVALESVNSSSVITVDPEKKNLDIADDSKSVIQKIPPKVSNYTADNQTQGSFSTKSLYQSGFMLPNKELCPNLGKKLKVAILVTSAPAHIDSRLAIRQTWGHYAQRNDVAIGFVLGRTASPEENASIREENNIYGDIIQANFKDSYSNLTLKTISILEWVQNYCSGVKFILKTDDDMYINVPRLLYFVNKHAKDKKKIYGRLARKWKPVRNKASKYYVSTMQYNKPLFPDFTTGPAYALTNDAVRDLYKSVFNKTYLKLEDVYMTGIVAVERDIPRIHVNEFFNRRVPLNACNIQKGISIHMIKPFEQYDLWKKQLDGRSKCQP